jgi:chemotaxis protein CheZ
MEDTIITTSAIDFSFVQEILTLSQFIQKTKSDIAAIHPKDIATDHIPLATDELDAVVGDTEAATNKIMDVCDVITQISEQVPLEFKGSLVDCTTQIFEACSFQDITGQRISKVVSALKHIDVKVDALLKALGNDLVPYNLEIPARQSVDDLDPSKLLNGPQLPGNGIDQNDVDNLLAGQ